MVDNLGRRALRCLLAAAAAALAGAPAALANDADLDGSFGLGGEALFSDPLNWPPGKGPEEPLNRNIPVDGFQDADGRIVVLSSNTASAARGEELPNYAFRLTRLTAAGAPDPAFAAGGIAGESAPLWYDDGPIFARDAHPGPGGSIYVLGAALWINRGPGLFVDRLRITRVANDGSLDSSFNEGDASRTLFDEECAVVVASGFRPDGKIAMLIDHGACDRGNGVHDELRVVSPDGTVDEAASSEVDNIASNAALSQLAFGTEAGQIVTYAALTSFVTPGDEPETPIVKFGPSGERDLSFGTAEGAAVIRGQVVELVTTAAGAPQVLSLDFTPEFPERGLFPDDIESVVTRLTGSGQRDGSFGTGGEVVVPTARPDLGPDHVAAQVGMTLDPKGRTHLIGTTFDQVTGPDPVRMLRGGGFPGGEFDSLTLTVNRLTASGARDATFGTGGEQSYPAPEGQIRFGIGRLFSLALGGTPEFHQADGKLVVPHLLLPAGGTDRGGFFTASQAAALRLSGTTVDPVVNPPAPPAPAAPAAAQGVSVKKPRTCRSRRAFTIRLRPKRAKLRSAVVTVNGKRVKVKKGKRFTAPVNLKGRIPATIRVRIVAKDVRGRTHRETRTYRTCRYAGRPLKNVTVG